MEHISVLKEEAIAALKIHPSGIYVDGTLGGGGHAFAICAQLKSGHVYGFDHDPFAHAETSEKLKPFADRFTLIKQNFVHLKEALAAYDITEVDGLLFDLGVSSYHFDDAQRGFSYRFDARLDMRMNPDDTLDAYTIVNTYEERALWQLFFAYGEEPFAKSIARNIVKARQVNPITTTFELVDIIKQSMPQKRLRAKGHPAKQTFQALRIATNRELDVLSAVIPQAASLLKPGGRLVIITFHSLEDRIVKQAFKALSTVDHPDFLVTMPQTEANFDVVTKKPILPTEEETALNPRSASAKMRILQRPL